MDRRTLRVVVAAFVAQGIAIGGTVGAFPLFVRPLTAAFEATTFQISSGISLITLTLAMCGVAIGQWLDRGSPRTIMFTGTTIIASTTLAASQATSLWQLAVLCVLTGVAVPMLGPLTTAAVVTKATEADRGRALGFANLGVPVGGFTFALIAGTTLELWGWRTTLQCFSATFVLLGLPAIAWGIPRDLGKRAPNASEPSNAQAEGVHEAGWTPKKLLASSEFRLIAFALGVGLGSTAGFAAHAANYLGDLGATARSAGTIVAASQGCMLVGTLGLGALADRRPPIGILIGGFATQLIAFALLSSSPTLGVAAALLALNGMASGGLLPVLGQLLAQRFGAESLGRAMGMSNLMMLPFGFGLPMVGGALRDATGSYASLLLLCVALFACVLVALFVLRTKVEAAEAMRASA